MPGRCGSHSTSTGNTRRSPVASSTTRRSSLRHRIWLRRRRREPAARYAFARFAAGSIGRRPCPPYGKASRRLAAGACAAKICANGLAAAGECGGGESAPEARGMECPAPLPRRLAAGSNALAPPGRGKAAISPAADDSARGGQGLAQCLGAVADRAPRGGDQPAVADEAVIDALIDGELARHAGCFEAGGQGVAVVEQRVEAADDQMRRRQARKLAEKRRRAPVALLLRPLEIGLPDPPHLGL